MKKEVFEIDINGYIIEKYVAEFNETDNCMEELAENIVTIRPPDGLYRAKWTGTEWIEDMTQAEIDALNNQPQQPTEKERLEALEQAMLEMILGGAE